MTRFEEFISKKQKEYGTKFDASDLAPQFIEYFNNNARIEVDYGFEKQRGRVSVTTGWRPVFLLMRRRSDRGSIYILSKTEKIIRIIAQ